MKKILLTVSTIVITIMAVVFIQDNIAKANPSFFPVTVQTATATTTVTYMTAGTATTTLTYDSYTSGSPRSASRAALLFQFTGSSTSATLRINTEYSQDGIDWYQDGGTFLGTYSTTTNTKLVEIGTVKQMTYTFSSAPAGLSAGTNATSTRAVFIDTPTRYVRTVFTLPVGSAAGAIWAQIVPIKESMQ